MRLFSEFFSSGKFVASQNATLNGIVTGNWAPRILRTLVIYWEIIIERWALQIIWCQCNFIS